MKIVKSKNNYNKNRKPDVLIATHIVKDCQKPKKEKETRKCYKYDKVEHLVKDCRIEQKIRNRSI